MSSVFLEASVGSRPALKEITENDRPLPRVPPAPKNQIAANRTPQQAEDIQIEGIENQINEESGQNSVSPLIILPDISNVQSAEVNEDAEGSHILTPADETCSLQTESEGNSTLTVPSITLETLSSDEEFFAECQSYTDVQGPFDEGINRSVHWDTVLSNVTSSNVENLENIEHTAEQAVADASLYLELHQELETEDGDKVQVDYNSTLQSSASPNSYIGKKSRDTKNDSAHSPDSTLRHSTLEQIKSVGLNTILDFKTSHEVNSLCCDNQSVDAKISSSVRQRISPNRYSNGIETKTAEIYVNKFSEVKNCIVRQNSPPKVTSTIDTEFEEKDKEAFAVLIISENKNKIHVVASPKLQHNSDLGITQLNTTFEAADNANALNQTIELSGTSPKNDNCVDQLNISLKVSDFHSNIELEESNKSETNNEQTRVMDRTMDVEHANSTEPMEVGNINCSHQTDCQISPKALGEPQNVFVEELMNRMDVTFKAASSMPTMPIGKRRSIDFPSEKDFQGHGLILNSSDFDFLLSKGCNSAPADDRNSVLLRFDPLVGHPSPVNQSYIYNSDLTINEEEDLNSKNRADNQSSEITETKEKLNDSNIVHTKKLLQNVPVQNIEKEIESPPHSEPLITEELNTSKELKQSNDKMSVDVIQGLDIGNDSKSDGNLRQKTENSQEYKVDAMEKKIKNEVLKTEDIEKKLKDAEQREEALLKRITEKDKTLAKMSGVIEAYEKAIAELIAEKEQIIQNYEKQMSEIKSERDLNYKHLSSLESTFTDLHAKYERSKQITTKLKSSEDDLKQERKQILENLRLQEQRYDKMKSHAMQQLEFANNKLESIQKNHSMEVTRLKALLKKEELSRLSVNEQLQQKTRENEELMKICDELINGQGATS